MCQLASCYCSSLLSRRFSLDVVSCVLRVISYMIHIMMLYDLPPPSQNEWFINETLKMYDDTNQQIIMVRYKDDD